MKKHVRLARWVKDSGEAFGYLDHCEVADYEDDYYCVIGFEEASNGKGMWVWEFNNVNNNDYMKNGTAHSAADAKSKAQAAAANRGVKSLSGGEGWRKLSEGEMKRMNEHEKLKKHLMGSKKLSAEEAEKKLSEASDEEIASMSTEADAEEKKLAEEEAEKAKLAEEEKNAEESKLSAAREQITRLSSDFRAQITHARLAARRGQLITRLSALRAQAKISPAEIKKLDLTELAGKSDEAVELLMKTIESREPVIHTGVYGTLKADNLSSLHKKTEMSRLEAETRANMSMLSKTVKKNDGVTRLAEPEVKQDEPVSMGDHEEEYKSLCALMEEGKKDEFKARLKSYMARMSRLGDVGTSTPEEQEKQLSALAESMQKMETQFVDLHKLAEQLVSSK